MAEGGMGQVYEAMHLRLHQRVAIKVLHPGVLADPAHAARFEQEARAAAKIESPYIAKVLDVDTSPEGLPYIVMEFLEGHDLDAELEARGHLPIPEAVAYVMEACIPVGQAHEMGIVHRDLKPSNLFLAQVRGQRTLKLLDFGISKSPTDDAHSTSSLQTLGTPHYMSPEQVRHAKGVDLRADIWALGVILYELLTGDVPFPGAASAVIAAIAADPVPSPRVDGKGLPADLESAIMKALEKDPNKRFANVHEFARALAPFAPEEELVPISTVQVVPTPAVPVVMPKPAPNAATPKPAQAIGKTTQLGVAPPPNAAAAAKPVPRPVVKPATQKPAAEPRTAAAPARPIQKPVATPPAKPPVPHTTPAKPPVPQALDEEIELEAEPDVDPSAPVSEPPLEVPVVFSEPPPALHAPKPAHVVPMNEPLVEVATLRDDVAAAAEPVAAKPRLVAPTIPDAYANARELDEVAGLRRSRAWLWLPALLLPLAVGGALLVRNRHDADRSPPSATNANGAMSVASTNDVSASVASTNTATPPADASTPATQPTQSAVAPAKTAVAQPPPPPPVTTRTTTTKPPTSAPSHARPAKSATTADPLTL
jgi:serine/threonine-protein kinase